MENAVELVRGFKILQAIPNTALWDRLKQEQRLLEGDDYMLTGDQNTLMNFYPTRPIMEIAQEYVEAIWTIFEPSNYLKRCYLQSLSLGLRDPKKQNMKYPLSKGLRLLLQLIWLQGISRSSIRVQFWQQLWSIMIQKPQVLNLYLGLCAVGEHFWQYREIARERITQQLGHDPLTSYDPELKPSGNGF
jgi:Domain of unknown function (DUF4070)